MTFMTTKTFSIGGDLTVNRLGYGAMRSVGTPDGPDRTPQGAIAVLRRAVELGVNHIDTAGFYGSRTVRANDLIRTALAPFRNDLVIATKVGPLPGPSGWPTEQAPAGRLRGLVEEDLRCLGLHRLDLVYLRVGGWAEPGGESVVERFTVLAEMRAQGLIRHLGLSNVDASQLAEAQAIAPVAAVQNRNTDISGLLVTCERQGIAYVPYFPLGGGDGPPRADRLGKVAARLGVSTVQVALAALLATSPAVLAIPGTGSIPHLEENIAANHLGLSGDDLAELHG